MQSSKCKVRRARIILPAILAALALLCPAAWGQGLPSGGGVPRSERSLIELSNGTYIAAYRDNTASFHMAYSTNGGSSWSSFTGTQPGIYYNNGAAIALATDGSNWYCAWMDSSTTISFASGSGTTYPLASHISTVTITSGGSIWLSMALDASNYAHIVYLDYSSGYTVVKYVNNISGSWNTPVLVDSTASCNFNFPAIAIDTTSSHSLYNKPQIVFGNSTSSLIRVALGNANNATSFSLVTPDSQGWQGYPTSIGIDANGATSIAWVSTNSYITYVDYLAAGNSWTTVGSGGWLRDAAPTTGYMINPSLIVYGTTRYLFNANNTGTGYYSTTTAYGSGWSAYTALSGNFTAGGPQARWSYANCPQGSLDYLYGGISFGTVSLSTTVTAVLSSTLSNVTASLLGGHGAASTLAGALSPTTASFAVSTLHAALAAAASQVTASLTGNHGVGAVFSGALSQLSASISAGITDFTAAVSTALSNVTASLSGGHGISAAVSGALSQAAAALSGAQGIAGTIAPTLSQAAASLSAGIVDYAAIIEGAFSQLAASLTGSQGITAAISGAFSPAAAALAGNQGVAAAISGALGQATASLAAAITSFAVQVSAGLSQMAAVLGINQGIGASLSGALSQVTASLSGEHGVAAAVNAAGAQLTAVLTGTISSLQAITVSLSGALGQMTGALQANQGIAANIAGAVSQAAAAIAGGVLDFAARIAAAVSAPGASLQAGHGVRAFLAGVLSPATAALAAGHGVAARISAALSPAVAQITAALQGLYTYIIRLLVPAENRTLAAPPENRALAPPPENRTWLAP